MSYYYNEIHNVISQQFFEALLFTSVSTIKQTPTFVIVGRSPGSITNGCEDNFAADLQTISNKLVAGHYACHCAVE